MTGVFLRVLLRRPDLLVETLRLLGAVARRGWFRRPPFLPAADPEYVQWRSLTAYGRADSLPSVKEAEEFLLWRRRLRRSRRRVQRTRGRYG